MRLPKVGEVWTNNIDKTSTIKIDHVTAIAVYGLYCPEVTKNQPSAFNLNYFLQNFNPPVQYYYVNKYKEGYGSIQNSYEEAFKIRYRHQTFIKMLKLVEVQEGDDTSIQPNECSTWCLE